MKASMANDLDAGKRLELDWLAGKVIAARPRQRPELLTRSITTKLPTS